MSEPATDPPPESRVTNKSPNYSLSEAGKHDVLTLARLALSLNPAALHLLIHLRAHALTSGSDTITISTTTLASETKLAQSAVRRALAELAADILITVRAATATRPTIIQVNAFQTVPISTLQVPAGVPNLGTPPAQNRHTLCLFEAHPVPNLGTPPTENAALARAAAASDLDVSSIRLIDRVFSTKNQEFDPETVAYFRRWMAGHMGKFGVDEDNQPLRNPLPPTDEEVNRFLRVDSPERLARLLQELLHEQHPVQKYIWFVAVALQRCAGIDVRAQKTARAALKQVKRSHPAAEPAAPAEQTGLDFSRQTVRQAIAGVKNLR